MPIREESIDFSDISGGLNTTFPRHALAPNQVAGLVNAICERIGGSRAPGYMGADVTPLFSGPVRGMWSLILWDGTEELIVAAESKTWSVDVTTSPMTRTQIGTLTSDTECWAVNAINKLWIVNGVDFVKIEKVVATLEQYRVGIAAPTAGTPATVVAGGSLAPGVYGVYYSYVRVDANGQGLYSLPFSLGNATAAGGNLTVSMGVVASADSQVTNIDVWMTDAGGAVPYFYGRFANASATVTIANATNRNTFIRMDVNAASNVALPISPSGIATFDDKLIVWGTNLRTVYWSLKTDVSPFDLERFLSGNFRTFSANVDSVFSVGTNLYINHIGVGVDQLENGDFSAIAKRIEKKLWFIAAKTEDGKSFVAPYKGLVFGLTNNGFRYFNGSSFSDNLSFNIKPQIERLITGNSGFYPSIVINQRTGKRTECRISYRDVSVSSAIHNSQLLFNLDFFFGAYNSYSAQYNQDQEIKSWEYWETGFSHMCIYNGQWIGAQSTDSGTIVIENGAADINCYNNNSEFLTVTTKKQLYLLSRTVIDKLDAITVWGAPYTLATSSGDINGSLILFDANNTKYPFVFSGVAIEQSILPSEVSGLGLPLPFVMTAQFPLSYNSPMPFDCQGNSIAIEITQIENDPYFFLYKMQLPRTQQVKNKLT